MLNPEEAANTLNTIRNLPREDKIEFLKSREGKAFFSELKGSDIYKSWDASDKREHKVFKTITDILSTRGIQ